LIVFLWFFNFKIEGKLKKNYGPFFLKIRWLETLISHRLRYYWLKSLIRKRSKRRFNQNQLWWIFYRFFLYYSYLYCDTFIPTLALTFAFLMPNKLLFNIVFWAKLGATVCLTALCHSFFLSVGLVNCLQFDKAAGRWGSWRMETCQLIQLESNSRQHFLSSESQAQMKTKYEQKRRGRRWRRWTHNNFDICATWRIRNVFWVSAIVNRPFSSSSHAHTIARRCLSSLD